MNATASLNAVWRYLLPIALLTLLWEALARVLHASPYILPLPSQIAARTVDSFGLLMQHAAYSTTAIVCGFIAATLLGFVGAVLVAYVRWIERLAQPLIVVSQVVPKVALAPLFLVWFGHGMTPKIVIVASIAFFPILVNTILGLKSADREVIELMDSVAASRSQIFWKIRLPTALPFLFPALKVAALLSVVGEMVGEFVASDKGLGYLMILSNTNLETDLLFAALLIITIIGLIVYGVVGSLEAWILHRFGDGSAQQLMAI